MARSVLVPVDDSDQATRAFEYALDTYPGAEITALHVVDPTAMVDAAADGLGVPNFEGIYERHREQAESLLDEMRSIAEERGVDIATEVDVGPVARTVVEHAADDYDHVVVGSHGRTGASRVLLGSVAERIVRRSPVPVTVVR